MWFKDPLRYQILEQLKASGLYSSKGPPFDPTIEEVEKCAEQLRSLSEILKNLASMKRNPRVCLEVMLWEHLVGTVGISDTRRLFAQLVNAASDVFNTTTKAIDVSGAVEQAVRRFAKLYPDGYNRLRALALRNKAKLTADDVRGWRSPAQHHETIARSLDERFDTETEHALDTWRSTPQETTEK